MTAMAPPTALAVEAAIAAARVIMAVYERPFAAESKADGSPVTEADQQAEAVIIAHLAPTGLPFLGEESVPAGIVPMLGKRYFVVDPLDGTREFVKRNGEFTVNIGLIEDGRPRMGVVLAPTTGAIFVGDATGAWEGVVRDGRVTERRPIAVRARQKPLVVASRSHGHVALAELNRRMDVAGDVSVGSSLKFCLLARGDAQLYPRFTPTCEWDTAAGQAVLEAAGGAMLTLDGRAMAYGKTAAGFLNPFFVAAQSPALARKAAAEMADILGETSDMQAKLN